MNENLYSILREHFPADLNQPLLETDSGENFTYQAFAEWTARYAAWLGSLGAVPGDRIVGITTPGQSGDPDSPHYRDLFEYWLQGRHVPFAFSREKVESVTENTSDPSIKTLSAAPCTTICNW